MRRYEQEITSLSEMEAVIEKTGVCRIACVDGDRPYIVPMNFGYDDKVFYFHGARDGKKWDIIAKNNQVCIELECDYALIKTGEFCKWGSQYKSIIAYGRAQIIEDQEEKHKALSLIVQKVSGKGQSFSFPDEAVERTRVLKVIIEEMTGKQSV